MKVHEIAAAIEPVTGILAGALTLLPAGPLRDKAMTGFRLLNHILHDQEMLGALEELLQKNPPVSV